MATLASAITARENLAFMRRSLPTLDEHLWAHCRSSFAALVPLVTRKPTRLVVGRLHYSLGPTLSAHFRWSFCASERLNVAS